MTQPTSLESDPLSAHVAAEIDEGAARCFCGNVYGTALAPQCAMAKDLCFRYNTEILPSNRAAQRAVLEELLGKIGDNVSIEAPLMVDNGFNIELGSNVHIGHNFIVLDSAKVTIGNNVFIDANVHITAVGHPIDAATRNNGIEYAYPVTIGDNVWIGANVCILPGVTIGSNVVIGAGSLVNKSIPDGVVAAGNPCKVVRPIAKEMRLSGH